MIKPLISDKKAIVSGGSRGIGFAITRELLKQGAKVLICSRSSSELKTAVRKLDKSGKNVFYKKTDISNYHDCKSLINYARKIFGEIDILVNNAGIYGAIGPFDENDVSSWRKAIDTNLLGTVYLTYLIIPVMKKNGGGKIINIAGAGIGGEKKLPRFSAYYASKMAIYGFTETVASELAGFNIQVNCISPGPVYTGITETLISAGPQKAGLEMYNEALTQKDRKYSPRRVSKLASFLASQLSGRITGKLISAKWDQIAALREVGTENNNLYTLRRIDNRLFYEKK